MNDRQLKILFHYLAKQIAEHNLIIPKEQKELIEELYKIVDKSEEEAFTIFKNSGLLRALALSIYPEHLFRILQNEEEDKE